MVEPPNAAGVLRGRHPEAFGRAVISHQALDSKSIRDRDILEANFASISPKKISAFQKTNPIEHVSPSTIFVQSNIASPIPDYPCSVWHFRSVVNDGHQVMLDLRGR